MEKIIEIEHLSKTFGEVRAVRDLSFAVERGELFAFLGVNGAGKSTTISVICGQLTCDGGSVRICGEDIDGAESRLRSKLGVVFQNSVLDGSLSVKDNLLLRASLYDITGRAARTRLDELADLLDFGDLLSRQVSKLSGGQRRRIDIARALFHRPEILILDEPTTGLDPQTRKTLGEVIGRLRATAGMTVFLTTHYMEEASDADHIVIIDSGRLAAEGTPLELKNRYTGDFVTLYGVTDEALTELGVPFERLGSSGAARLTLKNTAEATALITAHPEIFEDYEITKGKMDDVFLAATGKKLSENDM